MVFFRGETIRVSCEVRDVNAQLYDPTSISVSVWDKKGTKVVDATALSKDSLGMYSGSFATAATWIPGPYRVLFSALFTAVPVYDEDEFMLEVLPE